MKVLGSPDIFWSDSDLASCNLGSRCVAGIVGVDVDVDIFPEIIEHFFALAKIKFWIISITLTEC